ncbi:MAG: AAA family ATPase [Dehalococcoidales bacterium]
MDNLPEVVRALLNPETYPEETKTVRLVQTQMSFVFITDRFVYKMKKAVNLGYVDYTTLAQRKYFCDKEVELNRRLSPDTYIGVFPITKKDQNYSFGGSGEVMEYVVKMKILPYDRMLDNLLKEDNVTDDMMSRVARKMAEFHSVAATNQTISKFGEIEAVRDNNEENLNQMKPYIGQTLTEQKYQKIADFVYNFIQENAALFEERVASNKIKDCHGDLHAAHICFENGLIIYDCIEFNDRFRYCDVAAEVAFLAMDLDHNGRADLAQSFIKSYIEYSGDDDINKLLKFYKCYRACVRGKVACFKLDDPCVSAEHKKEAKDEAEAYFDLACSYANTVPTLLITVGLTGCGKSTIASGLAKKLGLAYLSSDITRKKLANIDAKEHRFDSFTGGIYSPEFTQKTYSQLFKETEEILKDGGSVIIDATFVRAADRKTAQKLAEKYGARFFLIECNIDDETARKRLDRRLTEESVSDGRWEIYLEQKKFMEPVQEIPAASHIKINNAAPNTENISCIIDRIGYI